MSFPQQETPTGSRKRARDEASEPGDEELDHHILKYQAACSPPSYYRSGGVSIGSNSAAAQGKWRIPPVPQSAHTGFANFISSFPNTIQPAQLGHGERQQIYGSAQHKYHVSQQLTILTHFQIGLPLASGGHPAHTAFGSNGLPPVQQQKYQASNLVPNQPYQQALPNQASTPAQPQMYQPTRAEADWYNTASHQLAHPISYVPRIPYRYAMKRSDCNTLLFPYDVLNLRHLEPKERYIAYARYSNALKAIYGQAPVRLETKVAFQQWLTNESRVLRDNEGLNYQYRQEQGDLVAWKQARTHEYSLAQLGLSHANVPITIADPQLMGHQLSYAQCVPLPSQVPPGADPGTSPNIIMPNVNKVSYQAAAGPENRYSSPEPSRGKARQELAPPNTDYSPPAAAGANQQSATSRGTLPNGSPASMGYQTSTAALPTTVTPEQRQQSSVQNHEQGGSAYGITSSTPIVIDDDEPDQLTSSYAQYSMILNAAIKRRRSDEQGRVAKVARTASYTKPIDLTNDSDEAATSPSLHAPSAAPEASSIASIALAPVRQTFANSENMKEFESFKRVWDQEKQQVISVGKRINSLPETLRNRVTNREFDHKDAWLAFTAKLQTEERTRRKIESARRDKQERDEKRIAQQERDAQIKKDEKAKTKAEKERQKRKEAEQKARQEQRRLQREAKHKEEEERAAQAQKEQEERKASAKEKETRELAELLESGLDDETQDVVSSNGHSTEVISVGDDEPGEQGSLASDDKMSEQGTSVYLHGTSTETTSRGDEYEADLDSLFEEEDNIELESLFDEEEGGVNTPGTSLEDDEMTSAIAAAGTSETVGLKKSRTGLSTEQESVQDEYSDTEIPIKEVLEEPIAEDRDGEEDDSDDEEEDPEMMGIKAQLRALDEEIARIAIHLSSANKMFKARAQKTIDSLLEKKRSLENEIARLMENKKMAQVEDEGGL
ncbi:uncharacterized protein CC84DRAFT_1213860 [Paraphaeosphaeria sporulosa]|uniref:Uncharacterized protein n=1 Tax=Paraphaeosphaeria sporulosa TaxID=1460663 RepID=A0A177CTC8_9PLEO|nr:uncharacterized protein CC84DRAFT_1213860 [Paraphaeosphaeria sporulosa]OAG10546.1 hypothetical protein CC84DRAFT_1213860 [Paraphaeosphaeria sporulosa]